MVRSGHIWTWPDSIEVFLHCRYLESFYWWAFFSGVAKAQSLPGKIPIQRQGSFSEPHAETYNSTLTFGEVRDWDQGSGYLG